MSRHVQYTYNQVIIVRNLRFSPQGGPIFLVNTNLSPRGPLYIKNPSGSLQVVSTEISPSMKKRLCYWPLCGHLQAIVDASTDFSPFLGGTIRIAFLAVKYAGNLLVTSNR